MNWKSHLHPEGQLYFQRKFPSYAVVTEANVHIQETESRVGGWIKFIDDIISHHQITIPTLSELFIELDGSYCTYYFVNHETRRLFWLEQISTELLDMGMVVSDSHRGMHPNQSASPRYSQISRYRVREAVLGARGILPNAHICADSTQGGR